MFYYLWQFAGFISRFSGGGCACQEVRDKGWSMDWQGDCTCYTAGPEGRRWLWKITRKILFPTTRCLSCFCSSLMIICSTTKHLLLFQPFLFAFFPFFHMWQLKDGIGVILKDRLFGGLSVAEAFVSSRVPPGYHPQVTLHHEVAFSRNFCTFLIRQQSHWKSFFLFMHRKSWNLQICWTICAQTMPKKWKTW